MQFQPLGTFLRCHKPEKQNVFENEAKRERDQVVALVLGKSGHLERHLDTLHRRRKRNAIALRASPERYCGN